MDCFAALDQLLRDAVARRAFPCAVAEVGASVGPLWGGAWGRWTYEDDSPAASARTVFDLASLTKPVVTATLAMRAIEQHRLSLDARVADLVPAWRGRDRHDVTVRDLLAHCAGLLAHLPLFEEAHERKEFERAIATSPLEYRPRRRCLYSDLGFMLLGFILEDAVGRDLQSQFADVVASADHVELAFGPPRAWVSRTAPTGLSRWRRRSLAGEVHDDNCWALGGVAGHAGLFGTAPALGAFARTLLADLEARGAPRLARAQTIREFIRRVDVPACTRALGWDTAAPGSSCGPDMPPGAIGHTGFTGTSLWIDSEAGHYFVLLTNRTYPTPENDDILRVRPAFHSAAIRALAIATGR